MISLEKIRYSSIYQIIKAYQVIKTVKLKYIELKGFKIKF